MQLNKKASFTEVTHEGAPAAHMTKEQALRRTVLSCLLFENNAYEDGKSIAERMKQLIAENDPLVVSKLAVEAREKMGLRHTPLFILREMARLSTHKRYVSRTLERVITRPDQMCDFLALYWKDGKQKLSAKVKQGLAHAFEKFDEYALGKYNRLDKEVKLRDVMFLCHPKPRNDEQEALWKKLIANELTTPDTWEVALSSGADKKETWIRLMAERKLGTLAFIRNLRNMETVKVDRELMAEYSRTLKVHNIFPYQFVAAAVEAPQCEPFLEEMLFRAAGDLPKLKGKTILLVDNSGSMWTQLNARSKMKYIDAACGLAMIVREQCEHAEIFSFSTDLKQMAPRRGFALRDAIQSSQGGATYMGAALKKVQEVVPQYTRIIVIGDEQSHDSVVPPKYRGYMINVANNKNGVGYGKNWTHLDGFSAATLNWIHQYENEF